jgi:hypothetical protein
MKAAIKRQPAADNATTESNRNRMATASAAALAAVAAGISQRFARSTEAVPERRLE